MSARRRVSSWRHQWRHQWCCSSCHSYWVIVNSSRVIQTAAPYLPYRFRRHCTQRKILSTALLIRYA